MIQANCARGALIALTVALSGCSSLPHLGLGGDAAHADEDTELSKAADTSKASEAGLPSELEIALRQAESQRKAGDLNGATRTLGQLVLVAPDDPRVLGEYGKTLVAKGQTDDALAFLIRAIELQPNDWTLYSAQGVAYDQRGNYAAAQGAYSRALALKPGDPTVLSNAGLSRMQSGDLEGAESLLQQAADAGGNHPRIAQNLTLVRNLISAKPAPAAAAPTAANERQAVPVLQATTDAPVVPSAEAIQVTEITDSATPPADANAPEKPVLAQAAEQPSLRGGAVASAAPGAKPQPKTAARKPVAMRKTAALQPPKASEQKVADRAPEVLRRLSPTD